MKKISDEIKKIGKELGIEIPIIESEQVKIPVSTKTNDAFNDVRKFVADCAKKVKLLYGFETPISSVNALAEYLHKMNPRILENKKIYFDLIQVIDDLYRSPKQLIISDFLITEEKLKILKSQNIIYRSESEFAEILEGYSNREIEILKSKLELKEAELEKEKFYSRWLPEEQFAKAIKVLQLQIRELTIADNDKSEEIQKLEKYIRILENQLDVRKAMAKSLKYDTSNDIEESKENNESQINC